MLPETFEKELRELPTAGEPEVVELILSKMDFDSMMEIIENPPEPPDSLLRMAAWYNEVTA